MPAKQHGRQAAAQAASSISRYRTFGGCELLKAKWRLFFLSAYRDHHFSIEIATPSDVVSESIVPTFPFLPEVM